MLHELSQSWVVSGRKEKGGGKLMGRVTDGVPVVFRSQ